MKKKYLFLAFIYLLRLPTGPIRMGIAHQAVPLGNYLTTELLTFHINFSVRCYMPTPAHPSLLSENAPSIDKFVMGAKIGSGADNPANLALLPAAVVIGSQKATIDN